MTVISRDSADMANHDIDHRTVDSRTPDAAEHAPTGDDAFTVRKFLKKLGPGLITGASDDDPSGIGTYSQAGAQLGYGIGWGPGNGY